MRDEKTHLISDIFQYASCPYRWYLCRVLDIDFDNIHTVTGTISHTRRRKGELRKNSETEYEQFDLSVGDSKELCGICDAVLFIASDDGVEIPKLSNRTGDLYSVAPLEYKSREWDGALWYPIHMQCVAQARCIEVTFNIPVNSYYVYYTKPNRRRKYTISENDRVKLDMIIAEMNGYLETGGMPPVTDADEMCSGCSCRELHCEQMKPTENITIQAYLKKAGK